MNDELSKKLNTGLTAEEVQERIDAGQVNGDVDIKTKSYGRIIRDNLFSLFNLINLILLICVLSVGSFKNALFFGVVIFNFAIGVIQEVRAKKTIESLSLLTAPKAYVLRDGEIKAIQVRDIVLGDVMNLKSGYQVCTDCVLLSGDIEVNESLVTGESDPIRKLPGDHLLSGSFVVAGRGLAETEHIGADNYATKITLGAKYAKKNKSVIMDAIKKVVRVITFILIPLSGLMIWKNFFVIDQSFRDAMIATVASISAMIPGGLILLVSTVMVVSVIKLSAHQTLVQELNCVENLARVDVICLDKTGTITEGTMQVEEVVTLSDSYSDELRVFADNILDDNQTLSAIRKYLYEGPGAEEEPEAGSAPEEPKKKKNYLIRLANDVLGMKKNTVKATAEPVSAAGSIPESALKAAEEGAISVTFSSSTKWSLVGREGKGSLILGAPEILFPQMAPEYKEAIENHTKGGRRVVALAKSSIVPQEKKLPEDLKLLAIVAIGEKIRRTAKATLDFFEEEGVQLKVISGDSTVTVSNVAAKAGLDNADRYVDATTLKSYEDIEAAVEEYTIFGRVTPYQKLDIIKALKAHGHTPAMVGDGANDVLALREADCSVAMQSGAEAARNVSNMVLMDSDFSHLPMVVAEGRKLINNLQRSSGLYLTKTTYAIILTLVFLFLSFTYPFQSIQITLVGVATIGMPSFFLALEPNRNRIEGNFLKTVFRMAVPSGVLTVISILASIFISRYVMGADTAQLQTVATYTAMFVGMIVILDICGHLNRWKLLLFAWLIFVAAGCMIILPSFFSIAKLTWQMWMLILGISALFLLIHGTIFRIIIPRRNAKQDSR